MAESYEIESVCGDCGTAFRYRRNRAGGPRRKRCPECVKEKGRAASRRWGEKNKERRVANATRWQSENRERHNENSRRSRKRKEEADPSAYRERVRSRNLNHKYGIDVADYEAHLAAQGGVCAICGRPPGARRLAVDHDHETGMNRDLLCNGCNPGLGNFGDDPERLEAAAQYLREWAAMASLLEKSKGGGKLPAPAPKRGSG